RSPFLIGPIGREVLVEEIGSNRKGMLAVGGPFERRLRGSLEAVLARQPGGSTPPNLQALVLQLASQAWAAVGSVGTGKGRADMSQQHQVLPLSRTGETASPGEVAALADTKNLT